MFGGGSAILTTDQGIAEAARRCGIDALFIPEHRIRLDGYDRGFIGGCCGLVDRNVLAFTGKVDTLECEDAVRAFLKKHNIEPLELTQGPMIDIGGILPLKELRPGETRAWGKKIGVIIQNEYFV